MIRSLSRSTVAACLLALSLAVGNPVCATAADPAANPAARPGGSKLNPANWSMPRGFRLPSFLVPNDDQDRIVKRKTGLIDDVKSTSARTWQRTKTALNPARFNPMNLLSGGTSTPGPGGESKPGFFASLFGAGQLSAAEAPDSRIAGGAGFLNQERPQ